MKDPFEDVDVAARKAVLYSAVVIMLIVVYGIIAPTAIALLGMLVAFFAMIMLHEFGHFIMAKRADMKVTEFFVGFGPRLWSVRRGETEYGIKAIPAGGYCKIIGMTNVDEIEPEDEARTYRAKKWHQKVLMAVAGPTTHFIIAFFLMFTVLFFAADFQNQHATTTLGSVSLGAQAAGLRPGDQLVSINDVSVHSWDQVHDLIVGPAKQPAVSAHIVVSRAGRQVAYDVPLTNETDNGVTRTLAGIASRIAVPHPGFIESVSLAPRRIASIGWDSLKALGHIFSPAGFKAYWHLLSGDKISQADQNSRLLSPVGAGRLADQAVRAGWVNAIGLLIAINVFVGILNLMPLLPFDGGHIAVATYEKIASRIRGYRVQADINKLMPITVAVLGVLAFFIISSFVLDITHPVANPF